MISQYPWKKDNSFSYSDSSILGNNENIEIAYIYMIAGIQI